MEIQQIQKASRSIQQINQNQNKIQGIGGKTVVNTDYNSLKNKPSINDIEIVGDKNGHDYNLANLDDLIANNIKTSDTIKTVQDYLSAIDIDNNVEINENSNSVSFSSTITMKITYIKGGNYWTSSSTYQNGKFFSAFDCEGSPFQYYTTDSDGNRCDFIFPHMSAFDEYDGKTIKRFTSEEIDLIENGEWEIATDVDNSAATSFMFFKTTLESLNILDIQESDDEVCIYCSPSMYKPYCCLFKDIVNIISDKGYVMSTHGGYLYFGCPKGYFDSLTGTTNERIKTIFNNQTIKVLLYKKKNPIEIIDYGEITLTFNQFICSAPTIQKIKFSGFKKLVSQITKNNSEVYKADNNGNINISVNEFSSTAMKIIPLYPFTSEMQVSGTITNTMYYGLSQDNVLYINGTIIIPNIKAYAGRFHIAQLPSEVSQKTKGKIFTVVCGSLNSKSEPIKVAINGNNGSVQFYADSNDEILTNAWFTIVLCLKIN